MYIAPESVDPDRHIMALYYVEGPASMTKMAEESAIENSTGTWTLVGYETVQVRKEYGAKIFRQLWDLKAKDTFILPSKLRIMILKSGESIAFSLT